MKKIFFDLDGTLADFEGSGGVDKMRQEGFFRNLKPYPRGLEIVKALYDAGYDIHILSTCIMTSYCKPEKKAWVNQYLPFIKDSNIILISGEETKAYEAGLIYGKLNKDFILFDDYKVNLLEWIRAGGTAIKCGGTYKRRPYPQVIKWSKRLGGLQQ